MGRKPFFLVVRFRGLHLKRETMKAGSWRERLGFLLFTWTVTAIWVGAPVVRMLPTPTHARSSQPELCAANESLWSLFKSASPASVTEMLEKWVRLEFFFTIKTIIILAMKGIEASRSIPFAEFVILTLWLKSQTKDKQLFVYSLKHIYLLIYKLSIKYSRT